MSYYGLEYVAVEFQMDQIPASLIQEVDEEISRHILEHRSPLRGVEVRFIRKTIHLSLAQLAEKLGVTAPTVLNWEKAAKDRLDPMTEVAVRVLFAEILRVKLPARFTALRGADTPEPITIKKAS